MMEHKLECLLHELEEAFAVASRNATEAALKNADSLLCKSRDGLTNVASD